MSEYVGNRVGNAGLAGLLDESARPAPPEWLKAMKEFGLEPHASAEPPSASPAFLAPSTGLLADGAAPLAGSLAAGALAGGAMGGMVLGPQAELQQMAARSNNAAYWGMQDQLRQLEPNNPMAAPVMSNQGWTPSAVDVERMHGELSAAQYRAQSPQDRLGLRRLTEGAAEQPRDCTRLDPSGEMSQLERDRATQFLAPSHSEPPPSNRQARAFADEGLKFGKAQQASPGQALAETPGAVAGGSGAVPPNTRASDVGGCEEPAKGEPGRSAGRETLAQRDPIPPALRADSSRAREIVRQTDPAIAASGLGDKDWQAHHLITREAAGSEKFENLFDAAAAAGWREDSGGNVVGLPTNCPAQEQVLRQGVSRPEHVGSHPDWNDKVVKALNEAELSFAGSGLTEGTTSYDDKAKELLEGVQRDLSQALGSMGRVTMLDARELGDVAA